MRRRYAQKHSDPGCTHHSADRAPGAAWLSTDGRAPRSPLKSCTCGDPSDLKVPECLHGVPGWRGQERRAILSLMPSVRGLLATSLAALSVSSQGHVEIRCAYTSRRTCTAKACKRMPPAIGAQGYLLVPPLDAINSAADSRNHDSVTVRRCDDQGCTDVDVTATNDGDYVDLSAPGYLVKLARRVNLVASDSVGDFLEVATFVIGGEVNFGHCPF